MLHCICVLLATWYRLDLLHKRLQAEILILTTNIFCCLIQRNQWLFFRRLNCFHLFSVERIQVSSFVICVQVFSQHKHHPAETRNSSCSYGHHEQCNMIHIHCFHIRNKKKNDWKSFVFGLTSKWNYCFWEVEGGICNISFKMPNDSLMKTNSFTF